MTTALVTIVARIAISNAGKALALIQRMGNPASPAIAKDLERRDGLKDEPMLGVHFASLHVIRPEDPKGDYAYLLLEFSADGDDDSAIQLIASRLSGPLSEIFALAPDWRKGQLVSYLKSHKLTIGVGWGGSTGLAFSGAPGMTVGRILREADLAEFAADLVGRQPADLPAIERLALIRQAVEREEKFEWTSSEPEKLPQPSGKTIGDLIGVLVCSFLRVFVWLPGLLVVLALAIAALIAMFGAIDGLAEAPIGVAGIAGAISDGLKWLALAALLFVVVVVAVLLSLYARLRQLEASDPADEQRPARDVLAAMFANENIYAQNHMVSVTLMKPGFVRLATTRFAFWIIGQLAMRMFKPGHLGEIGSIHFARWVRLPGTRQLVFLSNFDGSWENYLEDFITRAHEGLTAVWSNTVNFPRTENLFQKGATDSERFKRFARASMQPTPFWWSAYPTLSTANIRTNAQIRCGLASATTDEEAIDWLALFGSAIRPAEKLESSQIQSLAFGGLGFMPFGELALIDFADSTSQARNWLRDILPRVAFGDGRLLASPHTVTLSLGPGGLRRLGLPEDAVNTFPDAYLDGMTNASRARILGDDTETTWNWERRSYDVALLLYGRTQKDVDNLVRHVDELTQQHGHHVSYRLPLPEIPEQRTMRREPFGFVDGISQPVIRGTYRSVRTPDPIHLVEAGEFILGYPDNRGNAPPGPSLDAHHDPEKRLPIAVPYDGFRTRVTNAKREIGRNGTFLVIRQLEQDVDSFHKYCVDESKSLERRLSEPYRMTPDFIGAKIVGRWKDGSSLVRNPYFAFTDDESGLQNPTVRAATSPGKHAPIAQPAIPAPSDTATPKVESEPDQGETAAIDPPRHDATQQALNGRASRNDPADNDYLFGVEDPEGLRCPFGAHVRRANPRDSQTPGSQDQIDVTNRHRILRVGRGYTDAKASDTNLRGLLFMCLNADIERQFEFVQQTWLGSQTFHGLSAERDALAGNTDGSPGGLTIPTRDGPVRLSRMQRFVTVRGGGYFFVPGRRLLEFLSDTGSGRGAA